MTERAFAAVDLGASGGRVMAGVVDGPRTTLRCVHRFGNGVHETGGHLRWNFTELFEEVLVGLEQLARDHPSVESIGVDTWGVDYGLLDADGHLLAEPIAYRDERTSAVIDDVHALVPPDELYAVNGLQHLPFNTIYQLVAEQRSGLLASAAHVALLPDLLAYWLTGVLRSEATNASTTGLVDVTSGDWSTDLLDRLGLPSDVLSPIEQPGTVRGVVRPELCHRLGLASSTVVTTVGSHDTASAVVGVPATAPDFAYIASGTWSLVGLELAGPVLTSASRAANFTNEGGVDRRTRYLRNVGGLWLLQESMRTWADDGNDVDLQALLGGAASLPAGGPIIDVDDADFIAPGDMPARIADAAAGGHRRPSTPAETVRCVLDSLAAAYARTIDDGARLADHRVEVVHVVGGGSQNAFLCQLTADATGRPVVAGPVEATALGNVLVQARAHGAAPGSLEAMRAQIASSTDLHRFEPRR